MNFRSHRSGEIVEVGKLRGISVVTETDHTRARMSSKGEVGEGKFPKIGPKTCRKFRPKWRNLKSRTGSRNLQNVTEKDRTRLG